MFEFASDIATMAVVVGCLIMLVVGPWYFTMLRKVMNVAKDVDPAAWTDWGRPEEFLDLNYKQNRRFMRAIGKREGVNIELQAHPTFKMARRLYWVSAGVLFVMFGTIVVSGLVERFLQG